MKACSHNIFFMGIVRGWFYLNNSRETATNEPQPVEPRPTDKGLPEDESHSIEEDIKSGTPSSPNSVASSMSI